MRCQTSATSKTAHNRNPGTTDTGPRMPRVEILHPVPSPLTSRYLSRSWHPIGYGPSRGVQTPHGQRANSAACRHRLQLDTRHLDGWTLESSLLGTLGRSAPSSYLCVSVRVNHSPSALSYQLGRIRRIPTSQKSKIPKTKTSHFQNSEIEIGPKDGIKTTARLEV